MKAYYKVRGEMRTAFQSLLKVRSTLGSFLMSLYTWFAQLLVFNKKKVNHSEGTKDVA